MTRGWVRRNGQVYLPRTLMGRPDVDCYREMQTNREHLLLAGPPGTGKLLPLNTPIPTPTGWTVMGSLQVGDQVLGRDGLPTTVVYVSDVDRNPNLYRVTFEDGQTVIACADHQWLVSEHTKAGPSMSTESVRTTQQIVDATKSNFSIRLAAPLRLPPLALPVDPYDLGAALITERVTVTDKPQRIPINYLRASFEQRLALLQGFMDANGSVTPQQQCEVTVSSAALCRDLLELIRTFGIRVNTDREKYRHRLRFITTLPVFSIGPNLAALPSTVPNKSLWLRIVSITPAQSEPGKCIQVDNPEHMYLCGPGLIPTHNTAGLEAAFDGVPEGHQVNLDSPPGMITQVFQDTTTIEDMLGTFTQDPESRVYRWTDGPLTRSIRLDVPYCADEIGLGDPRLFSVLYPLMDGRGVLTLPDPRQPPLVLGSKWFLCAAYNPDVPGAQISEALLDRFHHIIEVETDWAMAIALGVPADIVTVAMQLNIRRRRHEISWSPQMRSLLTYRDQVRSRGTDWANAALFSKTPSDDREALLEVMQGTRMIDSNKTLEVLRLGNAYREPETDDGW